MTILLQKHGGEMVGEEEGEGIPVPTKMCHGRQ